MPGAHSAALASAGAIAGTIGGERVLPQELRTAIIHRLELPQGRFERRPFDFGGGFDEGTPDDSSAGRGKQSYTHMTLWAENTVGMHNLFRLSSLSSLEGFYRKPRMDRDLLQTYGKGIIGTTGCPSGEVNRWLQAGQYEIGRAHV